MPLPTRRPQQRAVVASASRLTKRESDYQKRAQQPWQIRALNYYDQIGELRYASQFYAKMLARVRMFPARLEDNGDKTPITSGPPVDLLNRIQDPGGGRSVLQRDYGRLMFITGEGVLFGSNLGMPDERWRFLWREEVRILDDGSAVRLDAQRNPTDERGIGYRMWTPHPKQSDLPDSPMRSVLDIAEELLILTASVRGTATTRLTNGILALASELSPDPLEPGLDEDPAQNPFLAALTSHIQHQIEDPGSAASKVPFILEGSFDYLDTGIKWIKTHDPATDYMERDMRVEAIDRLALALDFPPEELKGMTDANHWTAQQVQHDKWKAHGYPMAVQMAGDFAQAYLRPALYDNGYADWANIVIDLDDSQVVISPDRTSDADNAADRGMISDQGYRLLKGIPESMAPSEDEKHLWAAIKARDMEALDEALGIVPKAGPTPPVPAGNGSQPGTPPQPTGGRVVSRQEARVASIVGAAQLALRQCRARAGTMLRSKFTSCPECRERTAELAASLVASALGESQLRSLGVKDLSSLVMGGTDEFYGFLNDTGIRDEYARALCARIETLAARSLLEPHQPELPPGFVAQIEQSLEDVHVAA